MSNTKLNVRLGARKVRKVTFNNGSVKKSLTYKILPFHIVGEDITKEDGIITTNIFLN